MTKNEQVANIIAFFALVFGESWGAWHELMKLSPDYIIEKFDRYIESSRIEYAWGLHPVLRNKTFHEYVEKWKLELKDE